MISMLNPRVDFWIATVCVAVLAYLISLDRFSIVTFALGFAASMPISSHLWTVIEKNWTSIYRKFYLMNFYNRDMKIAIASWEKIWWLIPASLIVYAPISFGIMRFSNDTNLLAACVLGSVCATAWVSSQKAGKCYAEIEKARK